MNFYKARNNFFRGLEASDDNNKNTTDYVSLSFPIFWTSINPFLLAGGGVMRFPHFQEGPFQKEQRQLWRSLFVSLSGSKGVLGCGWESARLWVAARWASELPVSYVTPRAVRMRREGTASLRTGWSLLWRVALEMERGWDDMTKWSKLGCGWRRQGVWAAWSPCRSIPSG